MAKGRRKKERQRALRLASSARDETMTNADAPATKDATPSAPGGGSRAIERPMSASSGRAKTPTMRRAIAKRKKLALVKALAHSDRSATSADRKKMKRGARHAAKDLY